MASPQLRVPELVPAIDVRGLPLSAVDGYVLSRVDGRCSVSEIAALTGLGFDMVHGIVEKLHALGAIRYQDEAPARGTKASGFVEATKADPRTRPAPESQAPSRNQASPRSTPPRRPSSVHPPPRRPMSESGYSSPPPEMKGGREGPGTGTFNAPGSGNTARPGARVAGGHPRAVPGASALREERVVDRARSMTPPPMERTNPRVYVGDRAGGSGQPPRPSTIREERASDPRVERVERVERPLEKPAKAAFTSERTAERPPKQAPVEPQLYDPRELDEQADLPLERRKQLLDLYYRIEQLDYYEALGVLYTADKKDIRAAYFALSKVFHPDSMFRKELGSFKPKMEAVFKFLTEGYETLSRKKNRDEYDAYLRATKSAKLAEQALRQAELEANAPPPPEPEPPKQTANQKAFAAFPRPQAPPGAAPPREVSAEARKLAQEVVARRIRGASQKVQTGARPTDNTPIATPSSTPAAPPPEPPKGDPQELLRRLTRTLKDVSALTGTNDQVGRAVKASQAALARGDINDATQLMAKAMGLAPDREDLRAEHDKLAQLLAEKLANDYAEQAKFEAKNGKWASAALSWAKVCEGQPQNAMAHRHAAHALYKAGADLRGAQRYAQQAVFLAPNDIEGRILLTQIYMTIGLKLNAKRELDAAAKLDPANEMVKNLLADLKI